MYAVADFFRSRLGIALAALVVLAAVGAGAFFFLSGSSAAEKGDGSSASVPEGMIAISEAPALPAPDQARPATEAPAEAVAQVFLPEKCAAAAGPVRTLMTDYPSGLALDEAGSNRLNDGLAKMSTDCTVEEVTAFQAQELLPWMNYAVPAEK